MVPVVRFSGRVLKYKCAAPGCFYRCNGYDELKNHAWDMHRSFICKTMTMKKEEVTDCVTSDIFSSIYSSWEKQVFRASNLEQFKNLKELKAFILPRAIQLLQENIKNGIEVDFTITRGQNLVNSSIFLLFDVNLSSIIITTAFSELDIVVTRADNLEISLLDISIKLYIHPAQSGHINTPVGISSRGLLNIENKDNYCFLYCIYAHLFPIDGRLRVKRRPDHYHQMMRSSDSKYKIDISMLTFPVPIQDFRVFEQANNLSINVYTNINNLVYPIVVTKYFVPEERHINLLYIRSDGKTHFCLIYNLSAVLGNPKGRKYDLCNLCLGKSYNMEKLKWHQMDCSIRRYCCIDHS